MAAFGAALSALAGADAAEGAIVALTANPGTLPYGGGTVISLAPAGLTFFQFNNTTWKAFGTNFATTSPNLVGFRPATVGNTITTGGSWTIYQSVSAAATGTGTFAFLTSSNQVGWIRMNFGGSGGAITYLGAAFESTPGNPIVAGAIPEPATVGLFGLGILALGAAGVRKMRKRRPSA